jgi:hypothetical protein
MSRADPLGATILPGGRSRREALTFQSRRLGRPDRARSLKAWPCVPISAVTLRFAAVSASQARFVNRMGERFLAINVFSEAQSRDNDERMVVRSHFTTTASRLFPSKHHPKIL